MKAPLVSIIIPTYNRAHLIGETLDSVIAQIYTNWECIVVDDGSTDTTDEVLKMYCEKDSRIQYHYRPADRLPGGNAARNYGFELSKGEYIQWFDSDDIFVKDMIKSCVEIYEVDSNIDFVFTNYEIFNSINSTKLQLNKSNNPLIDYFAGKINLATGAVLWKLTTIKNIKFNESLKKTQELNFIFDLFKEFDKKSLKGFYNNITGYFLRVHESSIVRSFKLKSPEFLLSDIVVRNKLIHFFYKHEYNNVYMFNRIELESSLRFYLVNSKNLDFISLLFKIYSPKKKILSNKYKLFFFKLIYILTKRSYRFNREIDTLYKNEVFLNLK